MGVSWSHLRSTRGERVCVVDGEENGVTLEENWNQEGGGRQDSMSAGNMGSSALQYPQEAKL